MLLAGPEPAATLDRFYARARPAGAWGPVRARTGLSSEDRLLADLGRWILWVTLVLGGTLAIGWVLMN
jgi:hypothetical protein